MTDEQLKRLVKEGMEWDAEEIIKIINSDPTLKDVKCPEEVHDRLFEQIRLYEEQKAQEARDRLSHEDKELLRLGTIYRSRRKWNRYVVLAAALVAMLALGTVSIGEKDTFFNVISRLFSGGEQVIVDSEGIEPITYIDESEAYAEIEEEYGFVPIKLEYLPYNIEFLEATLGNEIQGINIIYGNADQADIIYVIRPNFRDSSFGTDIEDKKIQEYQMSVKDIDVSLTEYLIEDSGENRWAVQFEHQDVQYLLRITDMEQEEVEKIVNDLGFAN